MRNVCARGCVSTESAKEKGVCVRGHRARQRVRCPHFTIGERRTERDVSLVERASYAEHAVGVLADDTAIAHARGIGSRGRSGESEAGNVDAFR